MASPWPSYEEIGRPDDARLDALSGRSSLGVEVLSNLQEAPQVVVARHWLLTQHPLRLGRTVRDRMKRNLVWCHRCPARGIADCYRFCDTFRDLEDQHRVYDGVLRERNAQLVTCNEARTAILHEADADLGEFGTASSTAASSSSTPQRVRHLVIQTIVSQADQRTTRVTERAARSDRIDTQVQSIEDVMNNIRDSARVAWAARRLHGGGSIPFMLTDRARDSDSDSGIADIPATSIVGDAVVSNAPGVSSQSHYVPAGAASAASGINQPPMSHLNLDLDTRGMGQAELRMLVALANPLEPTADEWDRMSHVESDQSSEAEDLRSDAPDDAAERS